MTGTRDHLSSGAYAVPLSSISNVHGVGQLLMKGTHPSPYISTAYERIQHELGINQRGAGQPSDDVVSFTGEQAADQINGGYHRWVDSERGGKTKLTYGFSRSQKDDFDDLNEQYGQQKGIKSFGEFSAQQKQQATLSQQSWADVAHVTFTEKPGGNAHLRYGNYTSDAEHSGIAGFAFLPDPDGYAHDPKLRKLQGSVWINTLNNGEQTDAPALNNHARQTLTHEVGHGLGLLHPGDYELITAQDDPRTYKEDTRRHSIMSYNHGLFSPGEADSVFPSAPMVDDIRAVQKLYGANYETRRDDTTYGFNSNTDRDFYSLKSATDIPLFTIWDGGGRDTLDLSDFSQDQTINLNAGSYSSAAGLRGNIGIAEGVAIEEAIGGSGSDLLIGNNRPNVLKGGAGADIIFCGIGGDNDLLGGDDSDTFVFDHRAAGRPNWILDFVSGKDKIDLSAVRHHVGRLNFVRKVTVDQSKPQAPNDPTYSTKAGDACVSFDPQSQRTLIRIDTTGNGQLDMQLHIFGRVVRNDIIT